MHPYSNGSAKAVRPNRIDRVRNIRRRPSMRRMQRKSLLGVFETPTRRPCAAQRYRKLRVEPLEPRRLLSVDSGQGLSLDRAALAGDDAEDTEDVDVFIDESLDGANLNVGLTG